MAERANRFVNVTSKGVNLSDITSDVNGERNRSHCDLPKTEKQVEDIDINLIDEYDKNELIFGYNNYSDVLDSIKKTGTKGVIINVFKKEDGRFLCYSGNTRLRVLKEMGEKKVTCIIEGPVPDEHELMIRAICGNTQRDFDSYHIAQEIGALENSLREKGLTGEVLVEEIASITGFKSTAQKLYKQILKLDPSLQELFNDKNIPYRALLEACKNLPPEKYQLFIELYKTNMAGNDLNGEYVKQVFALTMKDDTNTPSSASTRLKLSKMFKPVLNLTVGDDGQYFVPDSKKEVYLEQVEKLEIEIAKIKAACQN